MHAFRWVIINVELSSDKCSSYESNDLLLMWLLRMLDPDSIGIAPDSIVSWSSCTKARWPACL